MKKAAKKVVGGKTESFLEKRGQHHDLVGMRSGDFFILGQTPFEHGAIKKKIFSYELDVLFLVDEGGLELFKV
jgi:hypothetical protein